MARVIVDRERALVTARSVLANVDILAGEGLDSPPRARVVEIAERLAAQLAGASAIDDMAAAELAHELREGLAGVQGRTASIYVTWLDGVLDPQL